MVNMTAKRTVLVADDDREVVASARRHLEKDGYQVFVAYDGLTALQMVRRKQPDVLLMDRSLLGTNFPDLGRSLEAQREVAIIGLRDQAADEDEPVGIDAEVSATSGKPLDPCDVLVRVRAALRDVRKAIPKGPEKMCCSDLVIDRRCHELRVRGRAVHLTPTEFRLLGVLAEEPGRAFTRLELLGRIFGYDYGGLERTVDTHVRNLRKKIEPDPTEPMYIETVYGVGYRFTGPRDGGGPAASVRCEA
jgi:DNA-binding response OmpR family regulator